MNGNGKSNSNGGKPAGDKQREVKDRQPARLVVRSAATSINRAQSRVNSVRQGKTAAN